MSKNLPLEGLKVIEMASVVATPIVARLLADYGAEVIKIESPAGDLLRPTGVAHELPIEDDNNPLFDLCNTGKKFTVVNLKTGEGKEIFWKMLEDADIFLSNIRMQSLEKMGVDYDSIKDRFPKLIYAHFSGFGLKGAEKNRPGYDSTAFWMRSGGSVDISTPGSFPLRPSFAFGDIATASSFLSAILMAVIGRDKTGKGTMVTTSLMQSGMWCNAVAVMNAQPQYGKQYPVDRFAPGNPLADYYECKDGEFVAIMQNDYDKDRQLFADLFHLPELLDDPQLVSLASMQRAGRVTEFAHKMQDVVITKTSKEWDEILDSHDIPHEVSGHFKDAYLNPQARAMECFDDIAYPGDVTTAIPRPPFDFSDFDRREFSKTAGIGSDTAEVLKGLGYEEEEIARFRELHVI
ncbi:MAG: CoA transferase [Eubacterium sp.]|nr:CoA transferase [Eubacterium sp.]